MDALTSQANVAGYKAAVLAADSYDRFYPMLTTAAGTMRPAQVLVLGAGVAGLQAIATARRLGAVVSAYDVRPASRGEVESLGARFLDIQTAQAPEPGAEQTGYARELTEQEQQDQRAALDGHIARSDVVITTAQVPGRKPPLLVSAEVVGRMGPGSVVVDLAASEFGGNVEGTEADKTTVLDNGVTLIGAGRLPSAMATAASTAYARNLVAVLRHLVSDGELVLDPADEITAALTGEASQTGGASS
jgi:NAD(P) transhydrogenase subunit alpha